MCDGGFRSIHVELFHPHVLQSALHEPVLHKFAQNLTPFGASHMVEILGILWYTRTDCIATYEVSYHIRDVRCGFMCPAADMRDVGKEGYID